MHMHRHDQTHDCFRPHVAMPLITTHHIHLCTRKYCKLVALVFYEEMRHVSEHASTTLSQRCVPGATSLRVLSAACVCGAMAKSNTRRLAKPSITKASEKRVNYGSLKVLEAKTTLAKAELTAKAKACSSSGRALRRRTSEQAVAKILKDHFQHFTEQQTDDKLNDQGNTLRQQLKLDRQNPNIKMGCRYYAEQRLVYDDEMSVMRQLRALDRTEPINSFVRMAVDVVEANPMSLSPLECPAAACGRDGNLQVSFRRGFVQAPRDRNRRRADHRGVVDVGRRCGLSRL